VRVFALSLLASHLLFAAGTAAPSPSADSALASRFTQLALDCVHKEYPNKIAHVLNGDEDVKPPRKLTPAFYGCFDWHSSVHGHWLLARLARLHPEAPFTRPARAALAKSLTAESIAGEVAYLNGKGRASFERPYGLAWLLQLAAELREWNDADARTWSKNLAPLETMAASRIADWLPKLAYPIREGEHAQTAFAFGLILDWARTSGRADIAAVIEKRSVELHAQDRSCPLSFEPSGQDFLSPCIAEADLLRRILPKTQFAAWLGAFLPVIPHEAKADWLKPGIVTDPNDGKLVHLHGLNLSRAWMLEGMAAGLPEGDPRIGALLAAAKAHREAGLEGVSGESYEGGHWLGTFATYLTTGRGLSPRGTR
jgi:hypothetical protein